MAVGALTASAYAFLPHGAPAAAAATASIAPTHTTANLEKLRDAFPTAPAETTCREGSERIAVVLYSALDALKTGTPTTELEATLFSSAAQVQGSTMTVPGRRIAVIRTNDNREPGASATEAMPGRYAGTLVIFDAVTSKPLCQTQLKASSATDTRWENVSPRALRSGYVAAVRDAVAEGAERLKIELDL